MKISETEKKVASLVAGELSQAQREALQEEIEKDQQARSLLEQMRQTADALSAWSESFEALPAPELPYRRRFPLLRVASLGAAVVLVSVVLIFRSPPPEDAVPKVTVREKSAEEKLSEELTLVREIAAGRLPERSEITSFAAAPAPPPGAPGAPPPGAPGAPAAPGDAQLRKQLESFARQFAFQFRIPPRLEGGFEIAEGVLITREQAMLVYKSKDEKKEITVFLGKSAGPDTGFVKLQTGVHISLLLAARKSGIAIGFDGVFLDKQGAEALAKHFLPERAKEEEEE